MSENFAPVTALENQPPQKKWGLRFLTVLAGFGIGVVTLALLLPTVDRGREAARRTQCKHNLRQIALALRNYESDYKALPPAFTVDAAGKPLHSWRTLLLPYLDLQPLYKKIDLSKPWDDPANAEACNTQLAIYQCPSAPFVEHHTTYLAIVGANACFLATESRRLSEITDAPIDTLMVIDAPPERSVPWMSPNDADEELVLGIAEDSKLAHPGGFQAARCDGSYGFYSSKMSAETRRALISIAGGDRPGDY